MIKIPLPGRFLFSFIFAHLPRHRAPDDDVVVEAGADDNLLGAAVLDGGHPPGVALHDALALCQLLKRGSTTTVVSVYDMCIKSWMDTAERCCKVGQKSDQKTNAF